MTRTCDLQVRRPKPAETDRPGPARGYSALAAGSAYCVWSAVGSSSTIQSPNRGQGRVWLRYETATMIPIKTANQSQCRAVRGLLLQPGRSVFDRRCDDVLEEVRVPEGLEVRGDRKVDREVDSDDLVRGIDPQERTPRSLMVERAQRLQ